MAHSSTVQRPYSPQSFWDAGKGQTNHLVSFNAPRGGIIQYMLIAIVIILAGANLIFLLGLA